MDQQHEEAGSQYQTNSFNPEDSGQNGWHDPFGIGRLGINYISPWDIWYRNHPNPVPGFGVLQPWYLITNGNEDDPTPYDIKVYSYVGLAYFDGFNDGVFNDPNNPGVSIPMAQSLGGNFPNLFGGSAATPGQEAGRLVRVTNSFDVPGFPAPKSSLRIESKTRHLAQLNNIPDARYPNLDGADQGFFYGNLTGPERTILYQYGKVFFYEVEVYDKNTGALVLSTLMHPFIETLPNGPKPDDGWKPVEDLGGNHLYGDMPNGVSVPLYFYNNNLPNGTDWDIARDPLWGNQCDSREVVFEVPAAMPYEVDIDGLYKLRLGFFASGQTGWVNSALHLYLGSR